MITTMLILSCFWGCQEIYCTNYFGLLLFSLGTDGFLIPKTLDCLLLPSLN